MNLDLRQDVTENITINEIKPAQEQGCETPVQPTKKELRHDILIICLALMAFIITLNVLIIVVSSAAVVFDADIQNMVLQALKSGASLSSFTSDSAYAAAVAQAAAKVMGLAYIISAPVSMLWMLTIRKKKLFTADIAAVNEKIKPSALFKIFALIMGMQFVSTVITYLSDPILNSAGLSLTDAMEKGMGVLLSTPAGIAAAVIVVPVAEEIVFRGAILRKLQRYGVNYAIVISSFLFGLYHMILLQSFFAFFVGLLLAYTAARFSLKWSMLLHVINNALGALLSTAGMGDTAQSIILISCAAVSVFILIADRKEVSAIRSEGGAITAHPYKITFSHPVFIIMSLMLLTMGFLTLAL
jgi:membrane protease YdiL (CAAX protease family)